MAADKTPSTPGPGGGRDPTPTTAANSGGAGGGADRGRVRGGGEGDTWEMFEGAHGRNETLPKQIGPYKIVKQLGRGGMGVVLLGTRDDDNFHKRVAIKLIRRGIDTATDGREVLKRFDLERQVLGALNHPNIARLLDAGQMPEPDGRPYFVMEYVEGEPIDEYCDRMELSTEQRLGLFQKVCAAVHHAHQNLVVHRDIKPHNIMVDVHGEPKLMDFGIVKLLNPAMAAVTLATSWDRGPMTPEYASPEQVQGKPISTASDVYALGVLLYELLTGRRPYKLKSRAIDAMVKAICEDEPERPSTVVTQEKSEENLDGTTRTTTADALAKPREGAVTRLKRKLAGDVDNIVLMAMRKSPQRRYPSAEALAADIGRHLGGQPVVAAPDSFVYRAGKFVRRNKLSVAAALLVIASIVGGGLAAGIAWKHEQAARIAEQSARLAEQAAKDRATHLLGAVRTFSSAYTRELPRVIAPLEDSTPALRALATSAIAGLGDLPTEFATDVDMQREIANAYTLAGRVRGGMRGGSEGDSAEGLKLLDQALKVRRNVIALAPTDTKAKMELATTLVYQGDALKLQNRPAEWKAAQTEALKIIEDIGDQHIDDPILSRVYAVTLSSRADALPPGGKDAGALIEKSLAIREQLAQGAERDLVRQRDVTVGLNRLALWHKEQGDLNAALPLLKRAYDIRENLIKIDANARTKRDVAVAASPYALTLLELSPPSTTDAEKLLTRALDLLNSLACSDASDTRNRTDLVRAHTDLGALELIRSAPAAAITHLTRAIDQAAGGPQDKRDAVLLQELARAREKRADAHAALHDTPGAKADYQSALALIQQIGPDLPGMSEAQTRVNAAIAKLK